MAKLRAEHEEQVRELEEGRQAALQEASSMAQGEVGEAERRLDAVQQECAALRQQLADGGGAQLHEEGAAVDRAEVREVAPVVEPLGDDREARRLLQVEPRLGDEVARREKVLEALADVEEPRAELLDDRSEGLGVGGAQLRLGASQEAAR